MDFVDDRPDDGVFRVDRSIYTDPAVFEAEMRDIFEGSWVYVAHESQIAAPGDYIAVTMGRQPVIINQRRDGTVGGLLNACAHRGALLTATAQGNAKTFVCRFHGWAFAADGRCLKVKDDRTGWPDGIDLSCHHLAQVPRVESYRGFIFASLNADVPPLADHLAGGAVFIDMLADQSPDGLEVLPGSSSYVTDGNWKLQTENGVDGYHVGTVHRNFAATVMRRDKLANAQGLKQTETARLQGQGRSGAYDLGNGHNLIWAQRGTPEAAPLYEARDQLEPRVGPVRWDWMCARGRNLLLFPNVFLMDQSSTQIRVIQPLGPDRTEITVYCFAPVGESAGAREARLDKFRDFFLMSGLATSDDAAALEGVQAGAMGHLTRWNEMSRGLQSMTMGADEDARTLGLEPVSSNNHYSQETLYYGQYRRWRDLIGGNGHSHV